MTIKVRIVTVHGIMVTHGFMGNPSSCKVVVTMMLPWELLGEGATEAHRERKQQ